METHNNQPNLEDSDHHQEQETLVDQGASSTQARSYECFFCKRGFSNAQALGGHMNIHRKHKESLKRSSSIDQSHQQQIAYFSNISSGDGSLIKWPDHAETDLMITSKYAGEIQQLPLFDDKPSNDLDHQQPSPGFEVHGMPSSETMLDLELRLGPDPQDSSPSSSMGTKKFF